MSKSPEEYFQEQDFGLAPQGGASSFTESELAFMRKYMGIDPGNTLKGIGLNVPETSSGTKEMVEAAPVNPQAPIAATGAESTQDSMASAEVAIGNAEPAMEPDVFAIGTALSPASSKDRGIVCLDAEDLETFKETASQQFIGIKGALQALALPEAPIGVSDTLYRGFNTIKNGASYLALEDIRIYAERTAGLVDQCRKSGGDLSIMAPMLGQEAEILEDMVAEAVAALESRLPAPAPRKREGLSLDVTEMGLEAGDAEMLAMAEASGLDERDSIAPPEQAPATPPEQAPATPPEQAPATPPAQPSPTVEEPAPASETPMAAAAQANLAEDPTGRMTIIAQEAEGRGSAQLPAEPAAVEDGSKDVSGEPEDIAGEEPLEDLLRRESELQMVGFFLGRQEFTVPTLAVQEVIRYEAPARLPSSPKFVAGVINLRGKMTPLVHLRDILEAKEERESEDRFIIVCRRKGLQIGLIIERVHTMYRVPQADIDWNIESFLGVNADFVSGLLKLNGTLVGIVSVDHIVDYVLN